jgi:hypothetical protein
VRGAVELAVGDASFATGIRGPVGQPHPSSGGGPGPAL